MLIDSELVKEFLPHREPFLFVDSVDSIVLDEGFSGEVNSPKDIIGASVFANFFTREDHPIFAGHFPGNPILPGVVQVEMMAQSSSFALMKAFPNWRELKMEVMLLGVSSAKFRKPVFPNMKLNIETSCTKIRGVFMTNECLIKCDGEIMSEASVLASVKFTEK